MSEETIGLDDDVEVTQTQAKDNDGIPYCRKHHCRMKVVSGGKKTSPTSYYACPVPGCEEKAQRIKTKVESVVPTNPQLCPRCSTDKKPVYCERDAGLSSAAMVILRCPQCQWKSGAMAVPQLAAAHFARSKPERVEMIGER